MSLSTTPKAAAASGKQLQSERDDAFRWPQHRTAHTALPSFLARTLHAVKVVTARRARVNEVREKRGAESSELLNDDLVNRAARDYRLGPSSSSPFRGSRRPSIFGEEPPSAGHRRMLIRARKRLFTF